MERNDLVMTPHVGVEQSIYECETCVDRYTFTNDTVAKEQTEAWLFSFMRQRLAEIEVDRFLFSTRELGNDPRLLRLRASVLIDHAHQP